MDNNLRKLAGLPTVSEKKQLSEIKTAPLNEQLFLKGSKTEIVKWLKENHTDFVSAMCAVNRGAEKLPADRKALLNSVKNDLRISFNMKEALEPFDFQILRKLAGLPVTQEVPEAKEMTIDLDIADWSGEASDKEMDNDAEKLAKKHNCTVKLKTRNGPGGGNPVYLFTGTEKNLRALYRDYMNGDPNADEEFDEFFLKESKEEEPTEEPTEEELPPLPEIVTTIAKQAEGKTGEELEDIINKVYDAGVQDGLAQAEEDKEKEVKEGLTEAARKDLAVKKAAKTTAKAEVAAPVGGQLVPSVGVNKEDDAGWMAVELAKAGMTVDMEEAMGVFYFNFKNKADADKAKKLAAKLQIELV